MIQYDPALYQWNMSVTNNPAISGVSYSDVNSLVSSNSQLYEKSLTVVQVIGLHTWHIAGDYSCSTQPHTTLLSLSSCDSSKGGHNHVNTSVGHLVVVVVV